MNNNILLAFGLTLIAGLSTGIGSAIAFFAKKTNTKFLAISLGFSAGVMIYVSMIEIFAKAKDSLVAELGLKAGSWAAVASFFAGMLLIAIIDNVLPNEENPHHLHNVEELNETKVHIEDNLMRTGIFTALAVGIHNFPEGLAAFISALQEPSIAIPITVAIAIHNIPEGISISAPIYYATGDRKKAFKYSFLSGLAEPIGALIGYLILMPFLNDLVFGIVFGVVAGIMVYISLDELLPSAQKYGDHHLSIGGLISGMAVMAVSLLLFI
ncbi:MAG TPA: zinc transporter ZupT [Sedimentibacter sp.]|jgi:ZIP family zinc transporter|nr:zinc transporter ZupT [Sedimentibacter sp.]NLA13077.1 zinc transporter ZupT [Tissierellia bacterium]HAS91724.1 zinc transporter ZupT [Clostridiales bacterium]HOA20582.1 zinc transporter ZupT [Sedimentibacter sp.]HOG62288.1 zinc transporter ZupT [Sedimentibacter sp.]